jgi:hypothetical protein
MTTETPSYHAYLLRCWREEQAAPKGAPQWRFSLEEVLHERQRWGFNSLEALVAFLQAEMLTGEDETASDTRSLGSGTESRNGARKRRKRS